MLYAGFMLVGGELRPLPVGSTLDPEKGVFSWSPGPGFVGKYDLFFVLKNEAGIVWKIPVRIHIKTKF